MPRPRSNRASNMRELKRIGDSLNSALLHVYNISQSYEAHKEYQIRLFSTVNEHTEHMLTACEFIATECAKLQTLIVLMGKDIENN